MKCETPSPHPESETESAWKQVAQLLQSGLIGDGKTTTLPPGARTSEKIAAYVAQERANRLLQDKQLPVSAPDYPEYLAAGAKRIKLRIDDGDPLDEAFIRSVDTLLIGGAKKAMGPRYEFETKMSPFLKRGYEAQMSQEESIALRGTGLSETKLLRVLRTVQAQKPELYRQALRKLSALPADGRKKVLNQIVERNPRSPEEALQAVEAL